MRVAYTTGVLALYVTALLGPCFSQCFMANAAADEAADLPPCHRTARPHAEAEVSIAPPAPDATDWCSTVDGFRTVKSDAAIRPSCTATAHQPPLVGEVVLLLQIPPPAPVAASPPLRI